MARSRRTSPVVLRAFRGTDQRVAAAGDQADHHAGRTPKVGGHSEASRRRAGRWCRRRCRRARALGTRRRSGRPRSRSRGMIFDRAGHARSSPLILGRMSTVDIRSISIVRALRSSETSPCQFGQQSLFTHSIAFATGRRISPGCAGERPPQGRKVNSSIPPVKRCLEYHIPNNFGSADSRLASGLPGRDLQDSGGRFAIVDVLVRVRLPLNELDKQKIGERELCIAGGNR